VVPDTWKLSVKPSTAEVGGGSLPEAALPSFTVAVRTTDLARLDGALRAFDPPVFARIAEDSLLLDVRTLLPGDEDTVVSAVAFAAARG
jgi:L-seryl-tRNA(Ser) seleniumtransferase